MNVLVFNCGSSSLKYRLIEMPSERELAGGEAQRVGPPTAEPARIVHHVGKAESVHVVPMSSHAIAFDEVMKRLRQDARLIPQALAHRVVHGGALFRDAVRIDDAVMKQLESLRALAPLHNPPATALIEACRQRHPEMPEVAVFDTAYHATIPEFAYTYPLPRAMATQLGIRKYGFHGTSHRYVAEEAAKLLGKDLSSLSAVSCHLGSGGASLCAIVNGESVDNTMGFSPLQGLVMSTRSGDLDPAVAMNLLTLNQGDPDGVEAVLNKRSGVLGLYGVSGDIRDVIAAARQSSGNAARAAQTIGVYLWRIRKYLGAYLAVVGKADAVIFTDTIGETVPYVRAAVCAGLDDLGLHVDAARNRTPAALPLDIAAADSPVRILVIATNEELAIARRAWAALGGAADQSGEVAPSRGRGEAPAELLRRTA